MRVEVYKRAHKGGFHLLALHLGGHIGSPRAQAWSAVGLLSVYGRFPGGSPWVCGVIPQALIFQLLPLRYFSCARPGIISGSIFSSACEVDIFRALAWESTSGFRYVLLIPSPPYSPPPSFRVVLLVVVAAVAVVVGNNNFTLGENYLSFMLTSSDS